MGNIKYYLLIVIVTAIAAGLLYLAILFDFFTISAFNTATECPPVYSGDNALEELNARLLYISLGNIALILLIFTVFSFSLKLVTSKNNMASFIICVVVSTPLIQTIYDSRELAMETINKCSHMALFSTPNTKKDKLYLLPPDLDIKLE